MIPFEEFKRDCPKHNFDWLVHECLVDGNCKEKLCPLYYVYKCLLSDVKRLIDQVIDLDRFIGDGK